MKLGLLTAPFADASLMDVADWSASVGFQALEIACWPAAGGEKRRYAGTAHVAVEGMTLSQAGDILGGLAERGISVSGLGYYPNPLHADAAHRESVIGHLKKVITAARMMKVGVVNTFLGGDRTLTADQNWTRALQIFPDIVAHARDMV